MEEAVSFYLTPATRANEIIDFVDGDIIGVYALDKSTSTTLRPIGNYADNKKYIYNSSKKSFIAADNDNLIFNGQSRKLEFYAYYPWYGNIADATAISHVIAGADKSDDFLFALNNSMTGDKNLPLSFKHLLSKVNVKYTSAENRENANMSVDTYTDMKVNLATGAISTIANKRTSIPLEKITLPDYLSFIGVVAPQTWKSGEKFGMLTFTGGASHPFSFSSDRTFASGELGEVAFMPKTKAYTFSVTPPSFAIGAVDKTVYPLSFVSQKDDAINGVNLPNTTVPLSYQLTEKPDWITITGKNILFSENRGVARTGIVTFTQDESMLTTSISVEQAAGSIGSNYIFTINGNVGNVSWTGVKATGESRSYTITSSKQTIVNGAVEKTDNITYTSSSSVDWITVNGGEIVVPENKGIARAGIVTFTQAESNKVITVTVQQSAANITYGSWNVSVSASPTTIAAGGGTSAISASASRDVFTNGVKTSTETATPGLAANGSGFSLSGTTLTASNNTGAARSCVVAASHGGVSNTCTVTQSAANITYGSWNVSVSASPTTIAAGGGTSAISASASRDVFTN
ncbi:MAG: fimbrillin family protein, partial [Bacteroidetes bacterium]|nr:fimbrillin family protein [Bacteroidota bacterium]